MIQTSNSGLIGRTKVLIVDHEYHARKTIRALLLAMGCSRIHEAGYGGTGLDAVRAIAPDVVLLDWDMPGIDGAEFVRRLRSDGGCAHANVPIIMLTGHREHLRVLQAVRHGVHEFLLKPVSSTALLTRIVGVLATPRPMIRRGNYYGPEPRKYSTYKPEFDQGIGRHDADPATNGSPSDAPDTMIFVD